MTTNPSLCPNPSRSQKEGGFALLLVFLLAAVVAFTLYQQLPRVAFESARNKEQILMDRGNQYKRAIELFYTVNKRYPAKIEELESTNDKRYLRRRYKDPMTGSDEWRLVHTNGSFLTDSLVQKPPAQNASNGQPVNGQLPGAGPLGTNVMNTNGSPAAVDSTGQATPVAVNPAVLRRPSDRALPQELAGFSGAQPNPSAFDPNDPRTYPPITLQTPQNPQPGQPVQPGQTLQQQLTQGQFGQGQFVPNQGVQGPATQGQPPSGQFVLPGFGGQGNVQTAIQSAFPSNVPGQVPGQTNQVTIGPDGQLVPMNPFPQGGQQPFQQPNPFPQGGQQPFQQPNPFPQGGQPPFQQPNPFQPSQPNPFQQQAPTAVPQPQLPNQALQAINDQLLRPNQNQIVPGNGGTQGPPGIAGVATTFKGPSIKAYRERLKYEEWEFVFQPAATQPVQTQQPQNQQQNPGQPQIQTPLGQQPMQQPGLPGLLNTPTIIRP